MKIVAQLIKDGQVLDTYTLEVPIREDFAEAAKKAFTYFRDRDPHMTVETDDVRIEFRDDKSYILKGEWASSSVENAHWRYCLLWHSEGHAEIGLSHSRVTPIADRLSLSRRSSSTPTSMYPFRMRTPKPSPRHIV